MSSPSSQLRWDAGRARSSNRVSGPPNASPANSCVCLTASSAPALDRLLHGNRQPAEERWRDDLVHLPAVIARGDLAPGLQPGARVSRTSVTGEHVTIVRLAQCAEHTPVIHAERDCHLVDGTGDNILDHRAGAN